MTAALVNYNAARKALALAHRVDEVKSIRDQAMAMQVYAKQAKDHELIDHATDIRMRAEVARRNPERWPAWRAARRQSPKGSRVANPKTSAEARLDLGINKTQSSRWQSRSDAGRSIEAKVARAKKIAHAVTEGDRKVLQAAKAEDQEKKRRHAEPRKRSLPSDACRFEGARQRALQCDLCRPAVAFEVYDVDSGSDRNADNHYPTMLTADIVALKVPAAKDAVLFLWATSAMLPDAMSVMQAWGFTYKASCIWNKDKIGKGYWFRTKHELLLVGVRGTIPAPSPGTNRLR